MDTTASILRLVWVEQCLRRLCVNIQREVAAYLLDLCALVFVDASQQLVAFDCASKATKVLHHFTQFHTLDFEGYTLLPPLLLVCCGGRDYPRGNVYPGAFLLSIRTSTVSSLMSMNVGRNYSPGLVCFQSEVYVFGGILFAGTNAKAATGEVLADLSGAWQLLTGQMSGPRMYFNPCVFQDRIYLSGGAIKSVDVCRQHQISALCLSLPEFSCVAVVRSSQLLFLSSRCTQTLEGEARGHPIDVPLAMCTKAAPVLCGQEVYFAEQGSWVSVELNTAGEIVSFCP